MMASLFVLGLGIGYLLGLAIKLLIASNPYDGP